MADSSVKSGTNGRLNHSNKKSNNDMKGVFLTTTEQEDAEKVLKKFEEYSIPPDLTVTREGFGQSILSVAATYGRTFAIADLLKDGANAMIQSTSQRVALHEACIGGHLESAKLLAGVTSDINIGDKNGQTAAHLAAFNGEAKVLKMLIEKCANMAAMDHKGRQPVHLAATRNHVTILRVLYENGVNLDCQCKAGKTPLHYAAAHGSFECAVFLVERDCDIAIRDANSFLPAHLAARHDKLNCLKFLIKHGTATDEPQREGRVCSHIAALYGGVHALHWLLETGTDVNLIDNSGNTSAHFAAEGGNAECFNCCLQHDADLTITNIKGDRPLDIAKKYGHGLLMEKSMRNEVVCPICFKKFEKMEYDRAHAPAPVERSITAASLVAYSSPLPKLKPRPTQLQQNLLKSDVKKKAQMKKPGRDLTVKYFGEHLSQNGMFRFRTT